MTITIGTPFVPLLFDAESFDWELFRTRNVHVFLDYDGTVTPIVSDPARAFLPNDMRDAISELTSLYPVSIVTGRGRSCIRGFLGDDLCSKLSIASSHGFDIHLQNGDYLHVGDNAILEEFEKFKTDLREKFVDFPPGCAIEENKFSVSIHYRNAEESDHLLVECLLDRVILGYPQLVRKGGKKVMEVRLGIGWNKGRAVDWILEKMNCYDQSNCFVVYIGDDVTDEDAFESLQSNYPNHLSIIVSSEPSIGRPTKAEYRMVDQSEVLKFLKKLICIRSSILSVNC
jgi:trehalose 6-phosphate phosphatase